MKLIVGLGNPGNKYQNTRHNIGFSVIEHLSEQWGIPVQKKKWQALIGEGRYHGENVLLMKPQTFMNRSGEAVRPAIDFYQLNVDDFVVIYDDLDLPTGHIRLRLKGSAGGHNGMKSIISHVGTDQFKRIRIGIDRPKGAESTVDYVLSSFSDVETELITQAIQWASDAISCWIDETFLAAMNRYNIK